jgi:hypothetical protein
MLAEEIRRTDRLEARARQMSTAAGALFAVVMATTAGVLNALVKKGQPLDEVVYWVGGFAILSNVSLFAAVAWTAQVQRTRDTDALDPDTIDAYVEWAEKGHVAVAKNLIKTYAILLRSRREGNEKRAVDLNSATAAAVMRHHCITLPTGCGLHRAAHPVARPAARVDRLPR